MTTEELVKIAQALYDMGVIEHYGRGIKRIKVRAAGESHHLTTRT